ncbi:helix-turn-helix domain-containing protein [Paraburkholderia caribensis]|uniref:hypothetical protein n=1 Tax=Paraburkholderia caribensis TaxID=75105 RepID=UPI0011B20967|nr:hypothetical protein [Paraburkholderia caribensis]
MQKILDENPELDQPSLAKIAGVTKATVNQWLDGKIKSMKLAYAARIQKRLGYNAVWLVLDEGEERIGFPRSEADVKSSITDQKGALSFDSARHDRARLLADTLLDISPEMRELVEQLVEIDNSGGIDKEMVVAGVGFVLKSRPAAHAQKKVK